MVGIIIGIGILLVTIGLATGSVVYKARAEPEMWKRSTFSQRFLFMGYWYFRARRAVLGKLQLEDQEERYFQGIYINEQPEMKRTEDSCRQGLVVLTVLFALAIGLLGMSLSGAFRDTRIIALERPEEGTGVRYLKAKYQGKEYEISLSVTEKQMTTAEVLEAWGTARTKLTTWILGANESLDQVTESLTLIDHIPGTAIGIQWFTSDYKVVDYEGNVHNEYAGPEGSKVLLTAVMSYGDWEERTDIEVTVLPSEEIGIDKIQEQLHQLLLDYSEEQKNSEQIELPKEWNREPVWFYMKSERSPWLLVALALLAVFGLSLAWESGRKQRKKEREQQLLVDYPDVVSKLTLLLEAGMTPRYAWERMVTDYQRRKDRDGQRRYAYEEMLRCRNQMAAGGREEQIYESFGKRCGNIRYLRLSSVLVQNLKKGTASIVPLLQKEAAEAFSDRKERAKQAGEEAGTKLLLPMGGILVLILAIVMIPAFMAF